MPKVSIVMPVFNAEKYIEQTLNSLLAQTYTDFEIIIVDDASKDNSLCIVEKLEDSRIRIYRNSENSGIATTRNRAIERCSGEYIALMDDDDIAPSNRIEKEVKFLEKNADIDIVGGHCRFIDEHGELIKNKQWNVFQNPKYIKAYLLLGDAIPNGSAMIRRKFIEKHSLRYLDNMYGAEDYRFWVECSLLGKIANLDEVLLYWRIGHNNETKRVNEYRMEQRKQALKGIRRLALAGNGIYIEEQQLDTLNRIFDEDGIVENMKQMKILYETLKSISNQGKQMKLDNAGELTAMCRKRFGEKVGKAMFLWD